jgi:hypothetical protein
MRCGAYPSGAENDQDLHRDQIAKPQHLAQPVAGALVGDRRVGSHLKARGISTDHRILTQSFRGLTSVQRCKQQLAMIERGKTRPE